MRKLSLKIVTKSIQSKQVNDIYVYNKTYYHFTLKNLTNYKLLIGYDESIEIHKPNEM